MTLKAGIITQARTGSTRLSGKIFLPAGNKSLLEIHIDRLLRTGFPVILATTDLPADNKVEDFAIQKGIDYFRGDEQNVLSRFYHCAKKFKLDVVARVTSDCPLLDPEILRDALQDYLEEGDLHVYYSNCIHRTFPRGFDFEIFSFRDLEAAFLNATTEAQKEHVTPYINQNVSGKIRLKHLQLPEDSSMYRITVDTPEDYKLVKILIEEYGSAEKPADEIIRILRNNPQLTAINKDISQKST